MKPEDIIKLIDSRRSIRQFKQIPLPQEIISTCVSTARLAPSARNLQPLEFAYIDHKNKVESIFPLIKWAGYINPDGNPDDNKHPVSYLVILVNKYIYDNNYKYDVGAAIENFILSTLAHSIGSCWILSVNRKKLRDLLNISEKYEIDSVIALGYPDEEPVIVDTDENIKYWKDEYNRLHVPKRKMKNIYHLNEIMD
jgi:nitroreductase